MQAREELRRRSQIKGVAMGLLKGFAAPTMKTDGRRPKPYPAFRRLIDRSGLAAFFSAGFFPSIGNSISFWPAAALRGFLPFAEASLAMLFFRASIRSTTFPPLGRALGLMVLPWRFALMSSVSASS